jgi:hypothetical protein
MVTPTTTTTFDSPNMSRTCSVIEIVVATALSAYEVPQPTRFVVVTVVVILVAAAAQSVCEAAPSVGVMVAVMR